MSDKAPDTLTLLVCPVCGKTDRFTHMKREGHHFVLGRRCTGIPQAVKYRKDRRPTEEGG